MRAQPDPVVVQRLLGGSRVESATQADKSAVFRELVISTAKTPPTKPDPRYALAAQGLGISVKHLKNSVTRHRKVML